ncbi:caspase-2-like isoform X1 [Macrosteles quadrilineatus]|uniref:caspase-2-like isoform X1 n=1 Tax=Macrosteles quadrilineatus TaxID=74068 RepID=UPI0023E09B63|nr:caspase-2-like isoform X1 [Macrosteles quadrilineatus]XP_054288354.1 caspase-2-like isoform X1 [Macrosteles quadrilineatus]
MEENHRKKILDNLDNLADGIVFNDLFEQLKKKKMFNSFMENEILERRQLDFLYRYVTTRGPDAFGDLCNALNDINRSDLANLLTSKGSGRVKVLYNGSCSSQPKLKEQYPDNAFWTVNQGSEEFDLDCEKVYRMRSSPRGLALVINIRTFVNGTFTEREGSERDVARLQEILPQLGYQMILEEELSANELLKKVREFSRKPEHYDCDSTMVIIMSHGNRHKESNTALIATRDAQYVRLFELINMMSAGKCEALQGKPKIFFVQTCWGDDFNHPVEKTHNNGVTSNENRTNELKSKLENGGTEGNQIFKVKVENNETEEKQIIELEAKLRNGFGFEENHNEEIDTGLENGHSPEVQTDSAYMGHADVIRSDSDIFIGYATSLGNVSMRDTETGSWFIQTLCRVFARDAWAHDLHSMLQTVKRECRILELDSESYSIEEYNQGFNKSLYFQPGVCLACNPIMDKS